MVSHAHLGVAYYVVHHVVLCLIIIRRSIVSAIITLLLLLLRLLHAIHAAISVIVTVHIGCIITVCIVLLLLCVLLLHQSIHDFMSAYFAVLVVYVFGIAPLMLRIHLIAIIVAFVVALMGIIALPKVHMQLLLILLQIAVLNYVAVIVEYLLAAMWFPGID